MQRHEARRAFTIIELLVVVSIIALLVGILLPAIGKARDQAKLTASQANLRNLSAAHTSYASEWSDRQVTWIIDNASTYGGYGDWFSNYAEENGSANGWNDSGNHTGVLLGWGHTRSGGYVWFRYACVQAANASLCLPIVFSPTGTEYFGSWRLANSQQFAQYVSGKFYDPVFYAPKDRVVYDAASPCFQSPDQWSFCAEVADNMGDIPAWSTYVLSPAAMYSPDVLRHDDPADDTANGFKDPFDIPAGFRSPAVSQARYPNLKTRMLEHHWLQGPMGDCNPGISPGTYGSPGCEPYYFNHAWESSPVSLFYDGHVESIGVRNTMRADGRMRVQTDNPDWGLWSQDTDWGTDGYLSEYGYDQAQTSFHVLTTDGIRGRDMMGD